MEFRVLGPLELVGDDGQPVRLPSGKPRLLLALLLLEAGRVVSVDRLISALWGDEAPATAAKIVQGYVSRLRKLCPQGVLETREPGYRVTLQESQFDLARFEQLRQQASVAAANGEARTARELLAAALDLWCGPVLDDVAAELRLPGELARLEELRLSTLEDRVELDLAHGLAADLVAELEALVAAHPLRERLRGQLMLALYRSARQAEALAVYQETRAHLVDELGLDPSPWLQQLEQAILRHDRSLELARDTPVPGAPSVPSIEGTIEGRKRVSVLLCDVVGLRQLAQELDPEVLRQVMARYFERAAAVIELHGGTIEKFGGDELMAVFGVPAVREDDALRAVRAALVLRDGAVPGAIEGLEVRIGVSTGEVVVGSSEAGHRFVSGEPIAAGKRLAEDAGGAEILLGRATYEAVAHAVEVIVLRTGVARLESVDPHADAVPRRRDSRFVGREKELRRLGSVYEETASGAGARLVTIIGSPGIGKSRLADEFGQQVTGTARVVIGHCLSYGEGITYWPLAEIASQIGDLQTALGDVPESQLAAARIAVALGTSDIATSPEEIAWGFRKLFEALASDRPLIVVLDDIHWAEPTLLDLIEYIAGFAQNAPLLLLCLARADLLERRPTWASLQPNAELIALEPLGVLETETLVDELGHVSAATKSEVVQAASGNPLFVEQFLAMRAEQPNSELEVPRSIKALLAARIDGLEPEARAIIERASIEGALFHRGTIEELLPDAARARVGGNLIALIRYELIRPDQATIRGDDGYRFSHILIRDAAYDSIPKRQRAALHEQFAGWLDSQLGDEAPDEIVGYHVEQAYRYRFELGLADEHTHELALRAGRLLGRAGRAANAKRDAPASCSLLGRATEVLPEYDPERLSLLILLGESMFDAGDLPRAEQIMRQVQAAARTAGERGVELRARMGQLVYLLLGASAPDTEAVLVEAEAAVAELEQLNDPESIARAWSLVCMIRTRRGEYVLKERAAARWLECAQRAGLHSQAAWAAGTIVTALAQGPTPVDQAIRRAEQVFAGFTDWHAGLSSLATLYAFSGRHVEAERTIQFTLDRELELGRRMIHAANSIELGAIALLAGHPDRVVADLEAAAEVLEAGGERGWLSTLAATLAEVLYQLARYEEAAEWTSRSEQAALHDDIDAQARWRSTRAKVLARSGDVDQALQLSAEALEQARLSDDLDLIGNCLYDRAEVLRILGRSEDARPLLEEALSLYERKGVIPSIERTRALLARIPAETSASA